MQEASQKSKSNPGSAGSVVVLPLKSLERMGEGHSQECPVVSYLSLCFSFFSSPVLQTDPAKICGRVIPPQPANLVLLLMVKSCFASARYTLIETDLSFVRFDLANALLNTSPRCSQSVKLEHLQHARRLVLHKVFVAEPMHF